MLLGWAAARSASEENSNEDSDEEESDEEEYQSRTRGPKPQRAEKDDAGQASQKKAFRFRPAKSTVPDAWHFWPVQESREEVKRRIPIIFILEKLNQTEKKLVDEKVPS